MTTFLYENGDGKVFDEHGNETCVYQMEIDNEQYPLEQLTNYDQYVDLKPPEKTTRMKTEDPEDQTTDEKTLKKSGQHRFYKDFENEAFFFQSL